MVMELFVLFDVVDLCVEKEKVLLVVYVFDFECDIVCGQYGLGWQGGEKVFGFFEEEGMSLILMIEIYVVLKFEINICCWVGVLFYLCVGKWLGCWVIEIVVVFKCVLQYFFVGLQILVFGYNVLVIWVQFDEGVMIWFGLKVLGVGMQVCDVMMDFGYGYVFIEVSLEVYECLIFDVLLGDFLLFLCYQEVEFSWKIFDLVEEYWMMFG